MKRLAQNILGGAVVLAVYSLPLTFFLWRAA